MKDSQQMSVDISSQNDMALQALPPVALKEANIYGVDGYEFNLTDVEDVEKGEKKDGATVEAFPESEDEILNKFVIPEGEEAATKMEESDDDKLEEQLLNGLVDAKETKEDSDNELDSKGNDDAPSESCVTEEKEGVEEEENKGIEEEKKEGAEEEEKERVEEEEKERVEEEEKERVEEEEKERVEEEEKERVEEEEKGGLDEEEKKEEDAEMKEKEDAEMKEKVNAELLKDQIMDTEDLLQIVDQQDTGGEPNENSSSGETTPDKEESDEADTETDKNDDEEDNQTSKIDDDAVDIDEGSPYKADFDSELDKEYEKIVNEKENEASEDKVEDDAEKMDEDLAENSAPQEDKAADDEKSSDQLPMETLEKTIQDELPHETIDTGADQSSDQQELLDSTAKTKRSLSESDATVEAKRPRLEEDDTANEDTNNNKDSEAEIKPSAPVTALNAISEYMQKRTLKKLTREDLEQICLMKMCEAICHKSEIGELRHQLSIQEQMIDMWRKEAAQLTKQARDLEIVNKRLLHEVRLKNDKDKPLIPVKITRSVGLQVRSDNNVMYNAMAQKRRFARPQQPPSMNASPKAPQQQPQPQQARFNQSKSVTSPAGKTSTIKPVQASPTSKLPPPIKPKSLAPKTPNSLLSKALQNSTAQAANSLSNTATTNTATPPSPSTTNTPVTPTTPVVAKSLSTVSPKTIKPTESKGVIDLTDEDEKKPSTNTTTVNTVRIVSTPVKNTSTVSSAAVVNPPRIMYLYNNQLHPGVLATDASKGGSQKVMFKLNSNVIGQANGVLTTVTNGQPISVSNGTVRTSQVQPVRFSSPVTTVRTSTSSKATAKHPAPLPPPPLTQINLAARKPIPPKPHLSIRRSSGGIVLSWKMPYNLDNYEAIASYQLYAYQETTSAPSSDMWRKVGDVKALALPMACTLTQFADGNKYHFAVRAVDVQKRMGPFSDPEQILL